jgi:hypothetical protein
MRSLPAKSELPLMAVAMTTVAALSGAAAVGIHLHAGDFHQVASGLSDLLRDWRDALPAALGGGGGADPSVPPEQLAEAVRTAKALVYTAVVSTDVVLLIELFALQDVSSTEVRRGPGVLCARACMCVCVRVRVCECACVRVLVCV